MFLIILIKKHIYKLYIIKIYQVENKINERLKLAEEKMVKEVQNIRNSQDLNNRNK